MTKDQHDQARRELGFTTPDDEPRYVDKMQTHTMKPRIRFIAGLWLCFLDPRIAGLGFTPADAYKAWKDQQQITPKH